MQELGIDQHGQHTEQMQSRDPSAAALIKKNQTSTLSRNVYKTVTDGSKFKYVYNPIKQPNDSNTASCNDKRQRTGHFINSIIPCDSGFILGIQQY